MKIIAVVLVVVLAAVAPAGAQPSVAWVPPPEFAALFRFLRELEKQIDKVFEWMWQLTDFTDGAREQLAPILDRVYAAQVLARRVQSLGDSLPWRLRWVFGSMAARLRSVAAPRPHSPRWAVEQAIRTAPSGDLAKDAQKLDQIAEQNAIALAAARTAAETGRNVAAEASRDMQPDADATAAMAAAREIALRAVTTPSTRAAVQLLVEAVAAQMDQQARMSVHAIGRQTALIQQQAVLGQQLSTVVDRLAAAIDQQNAAQKEKFAASVGAAYNVVEGQRQTYNDITGSLLSLNSAERQRAMDELLRNFVRRR